jgi:hypothetical protein
MILLQCKVAVLLVTVVYFHDDGNACEWALYYPISSFSSWYKSNISKPKSETTIEAENTNIEISGPKNKYGRNGSGYFISFISLLLPLP